MQTAFQRYIGIDYSGAGTPETRLPGLRVFMSESAPEPICEPQEIRPDPNHPKHNWTRSELAHWLISILSEGPRTFLGIDHGLSFPMEYFNQYQLTGDWISFLKDFNSHWPTDKAGTSVEDIRRGIIGSGKNRQGDSKWRRLCEKRSSAKSVFHFDVPGSVAKSTHAGLPWILKLKQLLGDRLHCWPMEGWDATESAHTLVEGYPSLVSKNYPKENRTPDQHDAYALSRWFQELDANGKLHPLLRPDLTREDLNTASNEGWIFGI